MKHIKALLERKFFTLLAIFWTALIFYLCLLESPNVPNFQILYKDKIVHFCFYFVFVFLWNKSVANSTGVIKILILIIAVIMGVVIEFMQDAFTVNRTFDVYDMLANTIGALTCYFYISKFVK